MTQNLTQRKSKELKERSHSVRNIKTSKELKSCEYFAEMSKLKDTTNMQNRPSKEANRIDYDLSQKMNSKTLNDHSDYIKTLYKKYLGKQNQIQSDKKAKVQSKIQKPIIGKEIFKDSSKINLKSTQQNTPILIRNSITQENESRQYLKRQDAQWCNSSKNLPKNKFNTSIQSGKDKQKPNYISEDRSMFKTMLNEQLLDMMGNTRSSMVRCMKNICKGKRMIISG